MNLGLKLRRLLHYHYAIYNIFKPTGEVHSRVFDSLLDYPMHNSTVDFRLRLLIRISRALSMLYLIYMPLSLILLQSVRLLRTHTMKLHVNDTSSVVGLLGVRHHPSIFVHLPSLIGGVNERFSLVQPSDLWPPIKATQHHRWCLVRACLVSPNPFESGGKSVGLFPLCTSCPVLCTPNSVYFIDTIWGLYRPHFS